MMSQAGRFLEPFIRLLALHLHKPEALTMLQVLMRILVLEDSPIVATILREGLEAQDWDITLATCFIVFEAWPDSH